MPQKYKIIELILIEKYILFRSTHPIKPLTFQCIQNSVLFILIVSLDSGQRLVGRDSAESIRTNCIDKNLHYGSVVNGLARIQDRQLKFLYTNECELCLFLRVVFGLWIMFREILYTLKHNYCFRMHDSTLTTGARNEFWLGKQGRHYEYFSHSTLLV